MGVWGCVKIKTFCKLLKDLKNSYDVSIHQIQSVILRLYIVAIYGPVRKVKWRLNKMYLDMEHENNIQYLFREISKSAPPLPVNTGKNLHVNSN